MELRGEHRFSAPRSAVWELLLDPAALRDAIPGCEQFVEVGPASYDVTVKVGISAIRGTFSGNVTLSDAQPLHSYRLSASGGGRPGKVAGEATITLEDDGGGTLLAYVAEVKAQGTISRLGSRLVGGAAKMMARRFFDALEERIERRAA